MVANTAIRSVQVSLEERIWIDAFDPTARICVDIAIDIHELAVAGDGTVAAVAMAMLDDLSAELRLAAVLVIDGLQSGRMNVDSARELADIAGLSGGLPEFLMSIKPGDE